MKFTRDSKLAFGRNNILNCLEADLVIEVFLQEGIKDESIAYLASKKNINVTTISKKELNSRVDGVHQGVAAIVKSVVYDTLEDVLNKAKMLQNPIVLLLDEINDPHNFGAIIRSAEAFGVAGIIIKKDRQVGVTPTVMKVATGAQNNMLIAVVTNLNTTIMRLKKEGFWVVSSELGAKTNVSSLKYDFKTAVIMGNEHKGVSKLLSQSSDFIVTIPMLGTTNSLNVSVATGIILAIIRQNQLYL